MSDNKLFSSTPSSSSTKSCYRLYAGHGNWINLSVKTTHDLMRIFQKGEPCRYQLAPGILIDIIPHDVDCNSKNIDMVGLMRADLVYEPQIMEGHVQQQMSHYIRSLLEDQGIIDAFPPPRQGENLPHVTSLPPHRHLSLVPSIVGTVRRGPKANIGGSSSQRKSSSSSSSSASSVVLTDNDHAVVSSSSSTTQGSSTGSSHHYAKRPITRSSTSPAAATPGGSRRVTKRSRQNTMNSIELTPHHKRQMPLLELPNLGGSDTNYSDHINSALHMTSFLGSHLQHSDHGDTLISVHGSHHGDSNDAIWASSYSHPSSHHHHHQGRPGGFNFEFGGMEFDRAMQQEHESPIDVLHEYSTNSGFPHSLSHNHNIYTTGSGHSIAQQHILEAHQQQQQQQKQHHHHLAQKNTRSDSTNQESFVPASPIPSSWIDNQQIDQNEGHDWQGHPALSYAGNNGDDMSNEQKGILTTNSPSSLDPSSVMTEKLDGVHFDK